MWLVFLVATGTAPSSAAPPTRLGASIPLRILLLPLRLNPLFRHHAPAEGSDDRSVGTNRSVVCFDVSEPTRALYLEIHGEVEFERVDVGFQDGGSESVDAFGSVRSNGLFEIEQFDSARSVAQVRVILRARGVPARVGLRLGV